MDMSQLIEPTARRRDLKLGAASIGGFWLFYFATVVLRLATVDQHFGELPLHALICLVGACLTGLVWLVLRRAANETMRVQVIAAAIAALPAAAILATFNIGFFIYQPVGVRTITEKGDNGTVMR